MADEIQIQPSSSSEILDLLLSAGLDKGVSNRPDGKPLTIPKAAAKVQKKKTRVGLTNTA